MKNLLTLIVLLGFTTALSAQFIRHSEKGKDKNENNDKQKLINLDTMQHIHYATISFQRRWEGEPALIFNFGDPDYWILVDAHGNRLLARDKPALFNLMHRLNWDFLMPLSSISIENGKGDSQSEWLFKRREVKQ